MRNRRDFIKGLAGGAAGALAAGSLVDLAAQTGARREVRVGGKRVKVVDILSLIHI